MADLSKDLCVISVRGLDRMTTEQQDAFRPTLVRGRLAAMQAFEKVVRASGNVGTCHNEATNNFIEGVKSTLKWSNYRLDVVELPKEGK